MRRIFFLIIVNLLTVIIFSQTNVGEFFKAGPVDGATLAKPYMKPYAEMLGLGLNSGWYTSAKVHNTLGFSLAVSGVYISGPTSMETYDVNDLDLEYFQVVSGSTSVTPTIVGDKSDRPVMKYKYDTSSSGISEFTLPNGNGNNYAVLPMITLGVGIPLGFEIKGRFLPSTKIGDEVEKVSLWGIGLQKDIKDYIPVLNTISFLDVSVLAGYTQLSVVSDVEDVNFSTGTSLLTNGKLDVNANAYVARLLVGADIPLISFFAGFGYGHSSTDFNVDGDFGIYEYKGSEYDISEYMHPIDLDYSDNSFDFNIGLCLRLGILGVYADYTVGKYSSLTGGLALCFR